MLYCNILWGVIYALWNKLLFYFGKHICYVKSRKPAKSLITIWRSSIRAFTPASISFRSWGVSGHGYKVALNLRTDEEVQISNCWPRPLYELYKFVLIHLPFTDLFDSIFQLISLEKYDENGLVDLVALGKHHKFRMLVGEYWSMNYMWLNLSVYETCFY